MTFSAPTEGPVSAPTPEVTTGDLALFAKTTDTSDLQEYVTAALQKVIKACGPISGGQWRFAVRQPPNARRLALPRYPTVTITSLDALADPLGVDCLAQLTENTDIDWHLQAILAPYLLAGLWRVTATLARPAADAASLKLAVKIIAKNYWEVQRGMASRPASYDAANPAPMWSGVPSRAKEIMKPYLYRPVG